MGIHECPREEPNRRPKGTPVIVYRSGGRLSCVMRVRSGVLFVAAIDIFLAIACPQRVLAQKRFALLIGNQNYSY